MYAIKNNIGIGIIVRILGIPDPLPVQELAIAPIAKKKADIQAVLKRY